MAVLFKAGDHVPVIPFVDVVGRGLNVAPEQIGAIEANNGVTLGFTVCTRDAEVAHCPVLGTNV